MAVLETIYTNSVSRRGDKDRALRLDRRCRQVLPTAVLVALLASIAWALIMGG